MRALVTGATGFVGRHLVAGLLDRGWEVCAMVRPGTQLSHAPHGVGIVTGDLLVPTTLGVEASATGPLDVVFHCAALLPSAAGCDPAQFLAANATATELLLNACERRSIRRFVYLSSIAVIGHPSVVPIDEHHPTAPATPYAVGKLGGEQACERARTRGMLAASLRLSSPYGPGMALGSVLPLFVHRALRGEPLAWHGSGSRSQDFIHVEDVVSACIGAATAGASGNYVLGSGVATSMRELAMNVASLFPGLRAGPSSQPDPQEGVRWQLDISSLQRDAGFLPRVALGEGIARYVDSQKNPSRTEGP